jgi:hypothetical protein
MRNKNSHNVNSRGPIVCGNQVQRKDSKEVGNTPTTGLWDEDMGYGSVVITRTCIRRIMACIAPKVVPSTASTMSDIKTATAPAPFLTYS